MQRNSTRRLLIGCRLSPPLLCLCSSHSSSAQWRRGSDDDGDWCIGIHARPSLASPSRGFDLSATITATPTTAVAGPSTPSTPFGWRSVKTHSPLNPSPHLPANILSQAGHISTQLLVHGNRSCQNVPPVAANLPLHPNSAFCIGNPGQTVPVFPEQIRVHHNASVAEIPPLNPNATPCAQSRSCADSYPSLLLQTRLWILLQLPTHTIRVKQLPFFLQRLLSRGKRICRDWGIRLSKRICR